MSEWDLTRHGCFLDGKILVTGASISAGWGTHPLQILREANAGKEPDVRVVATPGASSSAHMDRILATDPRSLDTIVAVDLFFWDMRGGDCKASLSNVHKLFEWTKAHQIDLVVGNIPGVGENSCGGRINHALEECRKFSHCRLLDFHALDVQFKSTGGAPYLGGTKLPYDRIRSDGLHLSREGATLMAEYLLREFDARPPRCEK
jgi:hypothetical protein